MKRKKAMNWITASVFCVCAVLKKVSLKMIAWAIDQWTATLSPMKKKKSTFDSGKFTFSSHTHHSRLLRTYFPFFVVVLRFYDGRFDYFSSCVCVLAALFDLFHYKIVVWTLWTTGCVTNAFVKQESHVLFVAVKRRAKKKSTSPSEKDTVRRKRRHLQSDQNEKRQKSERQAAAERETAGKRFDVEVLRRKWHYDVKMGEWRASERATEGSKTSESCVRFFFYSSLFLVRQ